MQLNKPSHLSDAALFELRQQFLAATLVVVLIAAEFIKCSNLVHAILFLCLIIMFIINKQKL